MLYKFKSRSTADLTMLEPQGRRLLQIIGKEAGASGIVTLAQIPAALAALEAAVAADERRAAEARQAAAAQKEDADSDAQGDSAADSDGAPGDEAVTLRQRAAPFIEMLRRSAQGGHDVVWGA